LPATGYAVLGLLSFGRELTGYELKQWADGSLRFFYWSPAVSQIYSELKRLEIGPVVQREEIEYFREIGLQETVTVTYALLAMSADGGRFTVENEVWTERGERAAVIRSTGGWLDLRARKLIAPPQALLAAFSRVPHAPDFVELPERTKRK